MRGVNKGIYSVLELERCTGNKDRSILGRAFQIRNVFKARNSELFFSLCNLCVLCASVVGVSRIPITTETQRRQRLHREIARKTMRFFAWVR
jgi:hypothetical protein